MQEIFPLPEDSGKLPLKPFQNDKGTLNCAFSFNSAIYWGPASMSAVSLQVGFNYFADHC